MTVRGHQAPDSWGDVDLPQLPVLAPPWRLTTPVPVSVWVSGYAPRGWSTTELDERWLADVTVVPSSGTEVRQGDLIIWHGEAGYDSDVLEVLWPPSRVVRVEEDAAKGRTIVTSVRDGWLAEIPIADVPLPDRQRIWDDGIPVIKPVQAFADVLQWWALDVWCPACGDLGRPIQWGLVPAPPQRQPGIVPAWGATDSIIAGCTMPPVPRAMGCLRCGYQWSGFPLAEPMWWPENAAVKRKFQLVHTPQDLLEATECADLTELAALVEGAVDLDDVEMWSDLGGVSLTIDGAGAGLPWPFTLGEFWDFVRQLEGRALCNQACRYLAREIEMTEGFSLTIWPDSYPDGDVWPPIGHPELPDYSYSRRAPGSWTYLQWFERRLAKVLARTGLAVEVYATDDEDETLETLRASSAVGKGEMGGISEP